MTNSRILCPNCGRELQTYDSDSPCPCYDQATTFLVGQSVSYQGAYPDSIVGVVREMETDQKGHYDYKVEFEHGTYWVREEDLKIVEVRS